MNPVKPKATKAPVRKVAAKKELELTAPVAEPKKAKRLGAAFSMYPDLHMAVAMLAKRQTQLDGKKAELIGRWVADLTRIQAEIAKWKKLEGLTEAVKRPTSGK